MTASDNGDPGTSGSPWAERAAERSAGRRWRSLSSVLLLTNGPEPPADLLPSLTLLPHAVRIAPAAVASVGGSQLPDAVLVDARRDLVPAKRLVQALRSADRGLPVLVIVTEGGWAALAADWGADDVVLAAAGPGEVDARLRLAIGRAAGGTPDQSGEIRSGDLVINEATYSARMKRRSLDLTFKEFELLKFLAQQPGRVFTRAQLLQEVWGYDYFGGTRTVDVHVRRLRAKLGAENEDLIGTVRNVGYRFVPARAAGQGRAPDSGEPSGGPGGGPGPGSPGGPEPEHPAAAEVPDPPPSAADDGRPGEQPPEARALASKRMTAAAGAAPHAASRPQSGTTTRRTAGAER
jgi:DNA-binding response OmpR family regulator